MDLERRGHKVPTWVPEDQHSEPSADEPDHGFFVPRSQYAMRYSTSLRVSGLLCTVRGRAPVSAGVSGRYSVGDSPEALARGLAATSVVTWSKRAGIGG